MHHFTVNSFHNHTRKSVCSDPRMSQQVNVEENDLLKKLYYISKSTYVVALAECLALQYPSAVYAIRPQHFVIN